MFKKLTLIFLLTILTIPLFGSFKNVNASAVNTDYRYEYNSSKNYEVDYITDDGKFEKVGSSNDFETAKALMKENKDYVVRCKDGYSPSRIVAMNSGLVYAYPRGSSSTVNVYQDWGENKYNYTSTYIERYYEMTYIDTPYMSAKSGFEGEGYCQVNLNGFVGFADLEYTDLVPTKFIDKGLPIYVGGPYSGNSVSAYATKIIPNFYTIKTNGNYDDLEYHYHVSYPDASGYTTEYVLKIDNAKNYKFMNKGFNYFSDNGFDYYSDYKKTNYVGTCYNYYSFLPMRTKTHISGSTLDGFIKYMRNDYKNSVIYGKGSDFISNGDEYGCNGALIFAMACQESAYGTSGYATKRNNLFGWNAHDDSPDDASYFSSVSSCIREHMGRNLRQYADFSDSRYNGTHVGNKGSGFNLKYASDPYWGYKIGAIYYNLDKYSNNYNGKLTDYNTWNLGVIKTYGAKIYSDANCTKQICTANYRNRQVANVVVILDKNSTSYKIQFSNPISSGNVIANNDNTVGYSWSQSVAYVKCGDIDLLNVDPVTPKQDVVAPTPKNVAHDPFTAINNVTLNDAILHVSGTSIIQGVDFSNGNNVRHEIVVYNYDDEEVKSFIATNVDTNGLSLNDGYNYKYSGYDVDVDLSQLTKGSYYLKIRTTVNDEVCESLLKSTNSKYRFFSSKLDNITYKANANYLYNYRYEIDVLDTCIDYSTINKPSTKTSLVSFDKITIDENGDLEIIGEAMIYYLNYNNVSDIEYKLYLVDSAENYLEVDTALRDDEVDYKKLLGSSYDLSHISFTASTKQMEKNLFDLQGEYSLILKIKNAEFVDFVELTNKSTKTFADVSNDTKVISLTTSNIRKRLVLTVDNEPEVTE